MMANPYAELGVSPTASAEDIRRVYRKLAKELHPDARPGDKAAEERFKRVTAAFNLLSDPVTRGRFDRGEIDADGNEVINGHRRRNGAGRQGFRDFSDVFSGVFGDDAGPFNSRGADTRYKLAIGFEEAANGGRKRVTMGDGKALELVIPEGVRSGQVLRLRGQGAGNGRGGAPGDALVEIDVQPHPHFVRDGDDIRIDVPVTLTEAVLGAKIRVPTLTGPVTVTVPRGSNSGAVLRLRGKGVKGEKGRGDQLLRLTVVLPDRQDSELQRFVSRWRPPKSYEPRKDMDV